MGDFLVSENVDVQLMTHSTLKISMPKGKRVPLKLHAAHQLSPRFMTPFLAPRFLENPQRSNLSFALRSRFRVPSSLPSSQASPSQPRNS